MKQLRLFWREDIVHDDDDEHFDCGMWVPATPSARQQAKTICEVQNAIYGPGSHWIEVRELEDGGDGGLALHSLNDPQHHLAPSNAQIEESEPAHQGVAGSPPGREMTNWMIDEVRLPVAHAR